MHSLLRTNEHILALFTPNLNGDHQFEDMLVGLTNQRIIEQNLSTEGSMSVGIELTPAMELRHRELAGLRALDLWDGGKLLKSWFFTSPQAVSAATFEDAFNATKKDPNFQPEVASFPSVDRDGASADTRFGAILQSPLIRLLSFAKPHYRSILLGLALTFTATGVGLIPPYLTMPLVDDVLVPSQAAHSTPPTLAQTADRSWVQRTAQALMDLWPGLPLVAVYLGALGLAAILAWLLAWAQGFVLARVSERVSADLRNRTYAHLQRLSLEYFGEKRTGDLIARISNDTDRLCSFLSDTLVDFITDVLMIASSAVVLLSLDPWLALATLGSFPLIASLILRVRRQLNYGFVRTGRAWSAMTNILADTIPGVRVVKAFAQETREIDRFAQANQRIFDVNDRINALWTFFWPLVGLLNQIGLLVVWAVGAWEVFHHRVTVGVLTAFIAYIGRFYARLESMSRMLTASQRAAASAKRLFEILDQSSTVAEPASPKSLGPVRGEMSFDRVSFRYGSRLVLDQVSFRAPAGQMVGIVGHTGSGKSTIANLACRFYDVAGGQVTLDGTDLRDISIEAYRKKIGIVLQDSYLFYGSISENIAYGEPGASSQKIMDAARVACAHEFILRLIDRYDSLVGERGQALSGGERQRVAIARAVLIDPKILILDEATSSVDVQTEREIQRALNNVVKGRTTIAIAHRLSTLRKANQLIVLSQGKLVESGTHAELLVKGGHYAELYRAQIQKTVSLTDDSSAVENEVPEEPPEPTAIEQAFRDLTGVILRRRGFDGLELTSGDATVGVYPIRCFPLTDPYHYVSLVDASGHERACIESLADLLPEQRQAVELVLRLREFIPLIERIERITAFPSYSLWNVQTDRGITRFTLGQEDHVRRLGPRQFVISDADGLRYMIKDIKKLDGRSRSLLGRFY
jgi:ATP-binding cassette, subfamily B, bacterial